MNVLLTFKNYTNMENENKDKNIVLTDEELKEVAGGAVLWGNPCERILNLKDCVGKKICKWVGNKCEVK
jgi:hypothetical protein